MSLPFGLESPRGFAMFLLVALSTTPLSASSAEVASEGNTAGAETAAGGLPATGLEDSGVESENDVVLATFRGGEVLASDVWREVRHLPKDERRYRAVEGAPVAQQWRDWIRRVALRDISRDRGAEIGLEIDAMSAERSRQEVRAWWSTRWRADAYDLPLVLPSDAELIEQIGDDLPRWPARIRLSHIYLRAEGDSEVANAVEQLGAWREEIASLEDFRARATTSSDSESARKEGKLGWLRKGWLPPPIEDVLYGLPDGAMSQPLPARGGVHLFWVEAKESERTQPLATRLERDREKAQTLALNALRDRRVDEAPKAEIGEGEWPRVTVGEWSISGEILRAVHAKGAETGAETAARVAREEALLQSAHSGGFLDADELARQYDLESNFWLSAVVEALVGPPQTPSESAMRQLYDSRPEGYQTQVLREIRYLKTLVPEGTDPLDFFRQLEALRERLVSGQESWEEAAKGLEGATFEHWHPRVAIEIASRTSPFLMQIVGPMQAGEITEVIQDGADFYIVEMVSREEARRQSFDEVRHLVERELTSKAHRQGRSQVAYQLLIEAAFTLTPEGEAFLADPPDPFADGV